MKRGGVKVFEGRVYARVRYGKNERLEPRLPWATPADKEAAKERASFIGELCDALLACGRRDLIRTTAEHAASATTAQKLETIRKAVAAIAKGAAAAGPSLATFYDVAEMWTSGELRKKHPDHVRSKADFKIEKGRLKRYIYPHLKDVPVSAFEVAHGDLVMAHLPPARVKKSATRRAVAQIILTVMNLAVMPLRLIKVNPLPRGWLPRIEKRKMYTCLFPREEAMLLRCKEIDEELRLFFGILDREGMRVSELLDSEWWQWNLHEGAFTATKNKTDDPRMWALRDDTARAMRIWHERRGKKQSTPFATIAGEKDAKLWLATKLREALKLAGVERTELFESTEYTGQLRAHDLRATFVTVSLAEGKADTWIRDRTGHKSTTMIDRYRRTARQFSELKLGSLVDLVDGLGWGISRVILATGSDDEGPISEEESGGSDAWIRTMIRGSKILPGSTDDGPTASIVEGNEAEEPPSPGGIPQGSPILIGLAKGLARERVIWDELESFVAALDGGDR